MCLILFIVYLSSFICIYTITDIMLYEKKTWKVINSISYVCNFIYARLFFFGVCLLPFVCNVFNVLAVAAAALVLLSVHIHLLLCFIQLIYRANEFMKNEFTLMSSESKWTVVALYLSTLFFFISSTAHTQFPCDFRIIFFIVGFFCLQDDTSLSCACSVLYMSDSIREALNENVVICILHNITTMSNIEFEEFQ